MIQVLVVVLPTFTFFLLSLALAMLIDDGGRMSAISSSSSAISARVEERAPPTSDVFAGLDKMFAATVAALLIVINVVSAGLVGDNIVAGRKPEMNRSRSVLLAGNIDLWFSDHCCLLSKPGGSAGAVSLIDHPPVSSQGFRRCSQRCLRIRGQRSSSYRTRDVYPHSVVERLSLSGESIRIFLQTCQNFVLFHRKWVKCRQRESNPGLMLVRRQY